jgi:hypothetical protein
MVVREVGGALVKPSSGLHLALGAVEAVDPLELRGLIREAARAALERASRLTRVPC